MSHQDIAVFFNVNHGPVSEGIKGKREYFAAESA